MITRAQMANLVATLAGVLIALVGAFAGYVTSATGDYHDLLRFWSIATTLSLVVLGWQVFKMRGWPRYIRIALIMLVAATSLDPLMRLVLLSSLAQ